MNVISRNHEGLAFNERMRRSDSSDLGLIEHLKGSGCLVRRLCEFQEANVMNRTHMIIDET